MVFSALTADDNLEFGLETLLGCEFQTASFRFKVQIDPAESSFVPADYPEVIPPDRSAGRLNGVRLERALAGMIASQLRLKVDREVVRGGSIIAPDVASKALQMFARMAKGNLTVGVDEQQTQELQDNEWRIIREVGAGLSNKEIAAALCLSEGTVRNYLSSILSKLDLRDRTQLAIWAVQTGVAGRPFGGPK